MIKLTFCQIRSDITVTILKITASLKKITLHANISELLFYAIEKIIAILFHKKDKDKLYKRQYYYFQIEIRNIKRNYNQFTFYLRDNFLLFRRSFNHRAHPPNQQKFHLELLLFIRIL